MAVSFNPAFRAEGPINTDTKQSDVKQSVAPVASKPDSVEISKSEPKAQKKGLISGFKNAYANTKKFFITTGYMISGTAKGAVYGTFGSVVVLSAAAVKNLIKPIKTMPKAQVLKDAEEEVLEGAEKVAEKVAKPARKYLTTGNKVLAGAVGVAILAGNMIAAKLNANEKGATVDHRWRTGHNNV